MIDVLDTEENKLVSSYKDQTSQTSIRSGLVMTYFFFFLTFGSSYLIYPFGALAYLKSKE